MSATSTASAPVIPAPGPRQLLLVGAGLKHLQVLHTLAKAPSMGLQITLITPHKHPWVARMAPYFVAGQLAAEACQLPLEPLVQRSNVQWLHQNIRAMDATSNTVVLDDGRSLHFDWASIDTEPGHDRESLEQTVPGARKHALFLHPLDAFGNLWPKVCAMADQGPLRFAVIADGAWGVELAFAIAHRYANSAVTLLTGAYRAGEEHTPALQQRLTQAFQRSRITVLQDRALAMDGATVQLGCGAALASDVTVWATTRQNPAWVARSGLGLDADGQVQIDTSDRSTSHPCVFAPAPGDPCEHYSTQALAGQRLARNLLASVQGQELAAAPSTAPRRARLLSTGDRALADFMGIAVHGAWVHRIKMWQDQSWLGRLV